MAFPKTGKYYIEIEAPSANATNTSSGIGITNRARGWTTWPGTTAETYWIYSQSDAWYHYPGSDDGNIPGVGDFGDPGTTWQFAIDMDNQKIFIGDGSKWYRKGSGGNTKEDDGNPVTGANPTLSGFSADDEWFFFVEAYDAAFNLNFGQRAFKYTAPAGHKCLCTQNLDDTFSGDELNNPSKYFDVLTYTGTGSSHAITGLNFGPDLVWIKKRNATSDHALFDQVRGVHERLYTNDSSGDDTQTNTLTAFGTAGFTLGDMADVNADGDTYVAWNWDAGTAVTNYTTSDNSADIASTVWKNQTSGLSIVKWESDGASAIKTVNHGLNAAPDFIITKKYSGSGNWVTFHKSFSNQARDVLLLDTTAAVATESNDIWSRSNTLLGYRQSNSATDGDDMIAYCWTSIPGYSSFGTYEGNDNANGPFIYTGFKPRWLLIKDIDGAREWSLWDIERRTFNPQGAQLYAHASNAEAAQSVRFDILSNGFKIRNTAGFINEAETFIYAAFAEHPLKTARAQ